jgi:hypothetical protein
MSAVAEQVELAISRLDTSPNGIYLVRTRRFEELVDDIHAAVKNLKLGPCMFIPLRPDESIELLSDERLAELGLKRIR